MLEKLETRTFFSASSSLSLTALRTDVAIIGRTIVNLQAVNKAAISNLQNDMSIFPTHLTTDHTTLVNTNLQFRVQISQLANDFNTIKVLIGQDITQLTNRSNAYNRKPTFANGQVVQASEQLLLSQGQAMVNTLTQDASLIQIGYQQSLEVIVTSHPLDATLTARVSHISTAFSVNTSMIHDTAETVALNDMPTFIAALEPTGVNNAAA